MEESSRSFSTMYPPTFSGYGYQGWVGSKDRDVPGRLQYAESSGGKLWYPCFSKQPNIDLNQGLEGKKDKENKGLMFIFFSLSINV